MGQCGEQVKSNGCTEHGRGDRAEPWQSLWIHCISWVNSFIVVPPQASSSRLYAIEAPTPGMRAALTYATCMEQQLVLTVRANRLVRPDTVLGHASAS